MALLRTDTIEPSAVSYSAIVICDIYAAIRHLPEDHRHGYWRARSICNGIGRAAHRDQRPIRIPPRRAGHDRRRSVPQLGVRGIPADYSLPRASVDDPFLARR